MPHISSKPITDSAQNAIEKKLSNVFFSVGKEKDMNLVLKEVFTKTESIMLAKRLTIIYLVHEKKATLDICDTLQVSPSTVARIELAYEAGQYKQLTKLFKKLEPKFWDMVEAILSIVPPMIGRGRYKSFNID